MFSYSPNIAINVRNRDEAIRFYRDVLGFTLVNVHNQKECGTEMKAGPITFWIDEVAGTAADAPAVGKVFFEFVVEKLTDSRKLLIEHGCLPGGETSGDKFVGQMFADPYGMRFHLYQKI